MTIFLLLNQGALLDMPDTLTSQTEPQRSSGQEDISNASWHVLERHTLLTFGAPPLVMTACAHEPH